MMPTIPCSSSEHRNGTFLFAAALVTLFCGWGEASAQLTTETWGWTYQTGDSIYSSPAVDSSGNIYLGSNDNKLYAFESNGTLKWIFNEATDWIDSSPAIGSDGTVYVGSWDNKLYAIDSSTGVSKWSFETDSAIISSPAIGADGALYFGSTDYFFYAVESNSSEKWSYFVGDEINSSPAIGDDGTIYFGANDGNLYALNENGTLKWSYTVPDVVSESNNTILSSPALDMAGNVYFGCSNGFFYSIADNDTSASLNWSYEAADSIDSSPVFGPEGNLYFISRDGYIRCIDPSSGVEYWSAAVGDVFYSSPVVDSQGYVYLAAYVGSGSNVVSVYNSTGTLQWTSTSIGVTVGGIVDSSLTITANGYLVFGCYDDKVYAISLTGNPTLADSDWPKFHRNLAADGSWPSYYVDATSSPTAGGTVSGTGTHNEGAGVILTATPATGYDFSSWSGDANGSSTSFTFSSLSENKSVTANFSLKQYVLAITAATGGSVSGAGTYDHGTTVNVTATPSTGYQFTGWSGATVADSSSASTTITLTQAESLTANFAINQYTLTVTAAAGGSVIGGGNYDHGATPTIAATPSTGYHFVNWTGSTVADANSATTTVTMDQSRNVTANFTIDQHVLTMNAGSGGSVSGADTYDYDTNASVTATPDTGYHFDYWTGAGTADPTSSSTTVSMTTDRNVSAVFAIDQHILTVTAGIGGSAIGDGTYDYDTNASVIATPSSGYHFDSWTGAGTADSTSASTTVYMTSDRNVSAVFAIDEYALIVTAGTNGSTTGDGNYTYEENASITATPDVGHHFVTWTGAGVTDATSASTTVYMTTDRNVTASFAIDQHVLTVEANSSGSVTGSETYDYGTAVTITATPDTGYQFSNWAGATVTNSTSASTTITLTADANVTANFVADMHELILNTSSGGSVSGDGNYTYGTNAAIAATPDSGYYFTGWSGDGVADANSSSTSVPMTEDRNLTASFAQIPPSEYVLQTFADPVGSGSTGGGGTYGENSSVTISATVGAGYQFLGWSASGGTLSSPLSESASSVTLDQSSDVNATAHFDALTYGLVLEASTGGSVSGDGNYSLGQIGAIAATAENGYSFIDWEVNGTLDFAATAAARQYDGSSNALYLDGKENPPLTLVRGVVYQFVLDGSTTAGHPFYFSSDSSGGGNSYLGEFTTGVTNSRAESGTVSITVDDSTPSTLYYYCGNHSGMGNLITVIDATGLVADLSANSTTAEANASYALRANFSLDQHLLTVNAGSEGSVTSAGTYDYGSAITIIATPDAGFIFSSWSGSGVADPTSATTTVSMTEDRNVTANFEIGSYVLSVTPNPSEGGSAIGGGSFAHGETTTIAATPDTGYVFSDWSGSGIADSTATSTTVTVTASQTITANFEAASYDLAVAATPSSGGVVSGAGTYEYETPVSITATPAAGYVFSHWSGSGLSSATEATISVTITADRNVTANFEEASYILIMAADPSAGGDVSGSGSYAYGYPVDITAIPVSGYVFSGWSGSGITDPIASSTTVTVTASQTVTASFAKSTYLVTLQSDPTGAGTLSGAGTYEFGSTADLNASPAHGYSFSHWSDDLADYNSSNVSSADLSLAEISPTVTQDIALTAHFVTHPDLGKLHYELGATEHEGGWKESDWFGFFHQVDDNWVFHVDFGWIYADDVTEDAFWYLDDLLGWLWTNGDVFPATWSQDTNGWIRFLQLEETNVLAANANDRLYYYDYSADQWTLALPSYLVTTAVSGADLGSVSGDGSYLEGDTAILTAVPADGFEFTGWSGDSSSTSATLSITVNSDLQVIANFSPAIEESSQPTTQEVIDNIFGR